jgi:hypothetical protein
MKRHFRSIRALIVVGFLVWHVSGCKRTPSPPTEQDAIAVWHNVNRAPHFDDLLSLTKTNGQMATQNGVPVYTLYYKAEIKSVVQLGSRPPGTVETYESNYPFQWSEKGWVGPDHQVYPEH